MKVYILCAGEGTRMWPFSALLPKPMWPINGKPCVRRIVEHILTQDGFSPVIVGLSKDRALYEHEFRDLKDKIEVVLFNQPLGTAGHINKLRDETSNNSFAIWYGDDLIDISLEDVYEDHQGTQADATLVLTNKLKIDYGLVDVDGKIITSFGEKPYLTSPAWTGIAILTKAVLPYMAKNKDFANDVFPAMIRDGKHVVAYISDKEWLDIGTISAYLRVNQLAKEGVLGI